ncbi:MAG: protein-L-isoaspartate(D-aspartate) O-methyltransferase, partial [Pyrinomonadaceae bacterium]
KTGGRLVLPVGEKRDAQHLIRVIKTEAGFEKEDHGPCAFVPLIGHYGWAAND